MFGLFEDWVVVFVKAGAVHHSPRATKKVALEYYALIPEAICIEKVRGLWKRRIYPSKPGSLLAPPSNVKPLEEGPK